MSAVYTARLFTWSGGRIITVSVQNPLFINCNGCPFILIPSILYLFLPTLLEKNLFRKKCKGPSPGFGTEQLPIIYFNLSSYSLLLLFLRRAFEAHLPGVSRSFFYLHPCRCEFNLLERHPRSNLCGLYSHPFRHFPFPLYDLS